MLSDLKIRFTLLNRSVAVALSTVSVYGRRVINEFLAPLVLFEGKVSFAGGVFEAILLVIAVFIVALYAYRFLQVIFGNVRS